MNILQVKSSVSFLKLVLKDILLIFFSDDHDVHSLEIFEINPPHREGKEEKVDVPEDLQDKVKNITKMVTEAMERDKEKTYDNNGYQEALDVSVYHALFTCKKGHH